MASGVQLEKWFKQGFELYKGSAGMLILASLITIGVGFVSCGILAGPMLGGLMMIGLRIHDRSEPAPLAGEVFKGFDYFKDAFLLSLTAFGAILVSAIVLNFVPVIGNIAFYAVVSLVYLVVWFAMGRVVEEGTAFWPAIQEAVEKIKPDIWMFLAYAVLITLAGSLGSLACVVGACLTIPLLVCSMATAYRDTWPSTASGGATEPPPVESGDDPSAENPTTEVEIAETDVPPSDEDTKSEKPPEAG